MSTESGPHQVAHDSGASLRCRGRRVRTMPVGGAEYRVLMARGKGTGEGAALQQQWSWPVPPSEGPVTSCDTCPVIAGRGL